MKRPDQVELWKLKIVLIWKKPYNENVSGIYILYREFIGEK